MADEQELMNRLSELISKIQDYAESNGYKAKLVKVAKKLKKEKGKKMRKVGKDNDIRHRKKTK